MQTKQKELGVASKHFSLGELEYMLSTLKGLTATLTMYPMMGDETTTQKGELIPMRMGEAPFFSAYTLKYLVFSSG